MLRKIFNSSAFQTVFFIASAAIGAAALPIGGWQAFTGDATCLASLIGGIVMLGMGGYGLRNRSPGPSPRMT
jgi:hypothetical protein